MLNKSAFLIPLLLVCLIRFCYGEFVIGIYGVNNPKDIAALKEAGFNCIQTYRKEPEIINSLALEAEKQGVKLVAYPDNIIGSKYENRAQNYPICAWYLYDEPDVCRLQREKLNLLDKKTKKIFPNHKTTFVIGEGFTEYSYYDIADILMVDWYPVPHLPLESFGENIALAKQGLKIVGRDSTPLWGVVQLFDWREYKQYRDDNDRIGRFPTKDEIRFMSYDAIVNGVNGLFYFIYTSKGVPLPEVKPAEWKYFKEVTDELRFLSLSVLNGGKEINNPVEIKHPLRAKSFEYGDTMYTILVNPTPDNQTIPKYFYKQKIDVLFEKNSSLKEIIKKEKNNFYPYKVFVFRYD